MVRCVVRFFASCVTPSVVSRLVLLVHHSHSHSHPPPSLRHGWGLSSFPMAVAQCPPVSPCPALACVDQVFLASAFAHPSFLDIRSSLGCFGRNFRCISQLCRFSHFLLVHMPLWLAQPPVNRAPPLSPCQPSPDCSSLKPSWALSILPISSLFSLLGVDDSVLRFHPLTRSPSNLPSSNHMDRL